MASTRRALPRIAPLLLAVLMIVYLIAVVQQKGQMKPLAPKISGVAPPVAVAQQMGQPLPIDEYRVKAQYLLNLSKFITWPNERTFSKADPLYICVYGANPLQNELDRLRELAVKNRPVAVRRIESPRSVLGCQILFVPGNVLPEQLTIDELAAAGVLTVGESAEFLQGGGMVSLLMRDNAVHIALNYRSAKQAGFVIDAGLLDVARKSE